MRKLARVAGGGFLVFAALLLPGSRLPAQSPVSPRLSDAPQQIIVKAVPVDNFEPRDPSRRRFGALEFRGGLELTSTYKNFGGISALHMFPDGERFLAQSDRGRWFQGKIVYKNNAPFGIADAQMAPMLGPDGQTLIARKWYDTESLTENNGTVYVGIERVNKIVKFDFAGHGLLARAQPVTAPEAIDKLPHNRGLECLATMPAGQRAAGALIAVAERALDGHGNLRSFLMGGAMPGEFAVVRSDEFDVSDCAVAPGGDLLLLERRLSWTAGAAIRIRRLPLASLVPGALVDGPSLLEADLGYQIDNMEGLGVHVAKDGTTVLTMISDDNFSVLQRTLLLQFGIVGE
jgi:hypothetical protein